MKGMLFNFELFVLSRAVRGSSLFEPLIFKSHSFILPPSTFILASTYVLRPERDDREDNQSEEHYYQHQRVNDDIAQRV